MPAQITQAKISAAILAYLQAHPGAADTAQGIACWWLPAELRGDVDLISRVLDDLAAQGLITRRSNADRHLLYSSATKHQSGHRS